MCSTLLLSSLAQPARGSNCNDFPRRRKRHTIVSSYIDTKPWCPLLEDYTLAGKVKHIVCEQDNTQRIRVETKSVRQTEHLVIVAYFRTTRSRPVNFPLKRVCVVVGTISPNLWRYIERKSSCNNTTHTKDSSCVQHLAAFHHSPSSSKCRLTCVDSPSSPHPFQPFCNQRPMIPSVGISTHLWTFPPITSARST